MSRFLRNERGGSMMEVVVAMMVLTMGILMLASHTTQVAIALRSADLRTERQVAYQKAHEELRSLPFESIQTRTSRSPLVVGKYRLWWDVATPDFALKRVLVYASGPSVQDGIVRTVVDTTSVGILRPYP